MPTLGPGFHTIPKDVYHSDPCTDPSLSASAAKVIAEESPAHAWFLHPRGGRGRRASTAAMDRGTALDSLLLGADTEIVVLPEEFEDFKKKAAQELRDAAEAAGKLPMIFHKHAELAEKATAIRAALAEHGIVFDGINQQTIIWTETSSYGPVTCRARLDHWKPEIATIYDLKIMADPNPSTLARTMVPDGHHIAGVAYPRGIGKLLPELAGRVEKKFVCVKPEPPYVDNITIATLSGSMRALGTYDWERAVEAWGRGVYKGEWPGWAHGEVAIEPLPWQMARMEAALEGGSAGVGF